MDALLALIIAMLLFAGLILMIHRSARLLAFIGLLVAAFLILSGLGVLG